MYDLLLQQLNMKCANKCQTDLMYYTWPPDTSTEGYTCIFYILHFLKMSSQPCGSTVKCQACLTLNNKQHDTVTITTTYSNRKINLQKLFNLFDSHCSCCYCVILLFLFLFIYSCGFTITHEEQQQHETVTTTRTTQTNLHKLLSVQEEHICYSYSNVWLTTTTAKHEMSKQMSSWPDVLHLATRCLYHGGYVCIFSIASPQNVKPTLWMSVNVKLTLHRPPLWLPDVSTGGTSALHLLKIWALKYRVMYVECSVLLLFFLLLIWLFFLFFFLTVSCCCCCSSVIVASSITEGQQQILHSNNKNSNREINLHKLFNLFVLIIHIVTV